MRIMQPMNSASRKAPTMGMAIMADKGSLGCSVAWGLDSGGESLPVGATGGKMVWMSCLALASHFLW